MEIKTELHVPWISFPLLHLFCPFSCFVYCFNIFHPLLWCFCHLFHVFFIIVSMSFIHYFTGFYTLVLRRAVLCDWVWWVAGGRPHRFPHNNFSFVYRIFTKLGHMIPLWKGKNPIYFGDIRSKVKVTININRISDNRVVSTW